MRRRARSGYRRPYFVVGITLLVLFLLQCAFDIRWPMLERLQANEVFKQTTGYGLLAYLLFQWRLNRLRAAGIRGEAQFRQMGLHKHSGAGAPLVFFVRWFASAVPWCLDLSAVAA